MATQNSLKWSFKGSANICDKNILNMRNIENAEMEQIIRQ